MAQEGARPRVAVIEDLLRFLARWLAFHILDGDKRLARACLAMERGPALEQAKQIASQEMDQPYNVLAEAVLSMHEAMAARRLQLMKEATERRQAQARLRLADSVLRHRRSASPAPRAWSSRRMQPCTSASGRPRVRWSASRWARSNRHSRPVARSGTPSCTTAAGVARWRDGRGQLPPGHAVRHR